MLRFGYAGWYFARIRCRGGTTISFHHWFGTTLEMFLFLKPKVFSEDLLFMLYLPKIVWFFFVWLYVCFCTMNSLMEFMIRTFYSGIPSSTASASLQPTWVMQLLATLERWVVMLPKKYILMPRSSEAMRNPLFRCLEREVNLLNQLVKRFAFYGCRLLRVMFVIFYMNIVTTQCFMVVSFWGLCVWFFLLYLFFLFVCNRVRTDIASVQAVLLAGDKATHDVRQLMTTLNKNRLPATWRPLCKESQVCVLHFFSSICNCCTKMS